MDHCEEAMRIFKQLTPENQNHLLMLTRLAYIAECAVKNSPNNQDRDGAVDEKQILELFDQQ